MIKKRKIFKNGGGCLMTNGHFIANKLVYSHLTGIFMCIHIWHWVLLSNCESVCVCIEYACIWYWSPRFVFHLKWTCSQTKQIMCSQILHEHHTIACALCDVHLKKKVRLYYKNISIHLGCWKIIKNFWY